MKSERTQPVSVYGLDQRDVVISYLSSVVFAFTGNANARSVPEQQLKVEGYNVIKLG